MHIVLAIHHALDQNSGAPGTTLDLARAYERAGHSVTVLSHDDMPARVPAKAREVLFPEFVALKLGRFAANRRVDVIDASTGDAWVWARLAGRARGRRPLLVTRSHGLEHAAHAARLQEAAAGRLSLSWKYPLYWGGFRLWEVATSLRLADVALFLNRHDRDLAIEQLRVAPERAHVVHNAIASALLGQSLDGLERPVDGELKIAQIGTYSDRKGTAYSIPALSAVMNRHPEVSVTFLGTACPPVRVRGDFPAAFRDRVDVVSSYRREDLPRLLRGHQIQLFPSLSEGFGKTLLEGMACGLAPVATDTPGPTEFITERGNGLLVPTRDPGALDGALESLLSDRQLLARLRRAAYDTAQGFSWERLARDRLRLYEAHLPA